MSTQRPRPVTRPPRSRRLVASILAGLLVAVLPVAVPSAAGHASAGGAPLAARHGASSAATYSNPIIAQTAPDPAIIKALDGYYYLIATSDYWQDGSFHLLPIFRSTDLVHWSFVGDSFPTRPAWIDPNAGMWAPDLQYFNHKYYMYYTAANTNPLPAYGSNGGSAIGVATAPSPAGPWTDVGDPAGGSYTTGPIVPPRACAVNTDPSCYYWTFDPAEFTNQDGQKYLYYGSYFGGTLVQKLMPDGLHTTGTAYQVGHWDRYEGTYVIRHDINGRPYYYNFSSTGNCCGGPNTPYSVVVNRATAPLGPFTDENGFPMMTGAPLPAPTGRGVDDPAGDNNGGEGGGYPTLRQNGNRWVGVGHNAIITDLSGQQWIVYHGVDKSNAWVNGVSDPTQQITFRQALLDRLDWATDGWPVVNGGAGPSESNAAPLTTPFFGDNFNAASGCAAPGGGTALSGAWRNMSGTWDVNAGDCTTGGYAEQTAASGQGLLIGAGANTAGYRAECDLRLVQAAAGGRFGCVVSYRDNGNGGARYLAVLLDPAHGALVTQAYNNGNPIGGADVTALPSGFDFGDWHHIVVEQDVSAPGQPHYRTTVSDSDRDPLAVQTRALPSAFGQYGGSVGFITQDAQADFDNVSIAPLSTGTVPVPQTPAFGALLPTYSDQFNGSLGPQWSWVHEDPTKHALVNGQLSITVNGDLYRDANSATNLLLETPPPGDYMIETKVAFDPNDNYQQAGLLIYSDDDHYVKIGPSHQNSLTKIIDGRETLEPLPAAATQCDVSAPAPGSNVAVTTYTRDQCPNEGESWDYLVNPQPTPNGATAMTPTVTTWLRIYKHGDVYQGYSSYDDVHWTKGTAWTLTPASPSFPIKIGLFAFSAGTTNNIPALFDYVNVHSYNP